jgi:hypothetical protein
MLRLAIYAVGVYLFIITSLQAHKHKNFDHNSCWHVINSSSHKISISCRGRGSDNIFHINNLKSKKIYFYQFNEGFADGLGFPEPNTDFKCKITLKNKKETTINFSTIDWGDRVKIIVNNYNVIVLLNPFWQGKASMSYTASII